MLDAIGIDDEAPRARRDPRVDQAAARPASPPREKKILLLRFFKNMTQSQIAEEIGVSQMHVSRLLTRTLDQLRASLEDERLSYCSGCPSAASSVSASMRAGVQDTGEHDDRDHCERDRDPGRARRGSSTPARARSAGRARPGRAPSAARRHSPQRADQQARAVRGEERGRRDTPIARRSGSRSATSSTASASSTKPSTATRDAATVSGGGAEGVSGVSDTPRSLAGARVRTPAL